MLWNCHAASLKIKKKIYIYIQRQWKVGKKKEERNGCDYANLIQSGEPYSAYKLFPMKPNIGAIDDSAHLYRFPLEPDPSEAH